jgi:hypothetical protein
VGLILLGVVLASCGTSDDENSSLIEVSTRDLHLEAVFGGSATTAQLRVTMNGLGVELVGREKAPWLQYDLKPDQFDFITYEFWPTATTLPGAHHAVDLRLDIYRHFDAVFKRLVGSSTVHLTYDIRNQIAYQGQEQLRTFHAVRDGAAPSMQRVRLVGERNDWKLSPSEPWLTVSPSNGTGLADLEIGIDMTQLPNSPGSYSATLTAKGSGSSETATLPIALLLDSPNFSLPRQSIALISDAGAKVEPEVVPVLDTASGGMPFLVEASESWVSVGGDTRTGGTLRIGASAGMKPGIHRATITLVADEAQLPANFQVPPAALLNVSLYVSEAPLVANAEFQLPLYAHHPVADPLRPYVYVIVDDRTLEAYDIETGERVASTVFSSPLGNAVISGQADQLYVAETGKRKVHALALPMLRESHAFDVAGTGAPELALTHCAGRNQLWSLSEELEAWDLETLAVVTPIEVPRLYPPSDGSPPHVFQSPTGDALLFSKAPLSDPEFEAFDVACGAAADEPVRLHWRAALPIALARTVARPPQISADGRTVCFQTCFDARTMTPLTELSTVAADALQYQFFSQLLFGSKGGIFVADNDGKVLRFDSAWQPTGSIQAMPPASNTSLPLKYELFLSSDERRLGSLNEHAVLNVWNAH